LQQLEPIFAISAAALLLREPLTKRFFALAATALVGAYLLSFPELKVDLSTGNGTLIAALFAVGAAASWGISTAFSKYSLKGTSTLHITALRFGFTPVFALLFVLLGGHAAALGDALTADNFKYIVAITFSTGMVALLIYYFGLKRIPASRSSILELTFPLSAVIIGYLFLDQGFNLTQGIGALILIGTIYLIGKDANKLALARETIKNKK
ncbi:MAG TPA: DMT family transporter, partial [Candidatus Saccharimonadales bacterium]|nr:DMT family transporter [Candidatus Saccharimonadales bacterium]